MQRQRPTPARRWGNNGGASPLSSSLHYSSHAHKPLPALMFVDKMVREGGEYRRAIESMRRRLGGSNPIPVQLPLYCRPLSRASSSSFETKSWALGDAIVAGGLVDNHGEFVGVLNLVQKRAMVYPKDAKSLSMEDAALSVIYLSLREQRGGGLQQGGLSLMRAASGGRQELVSNLANVDEVMEDLYLHAVMGNNKVDGGADYHSCPILGSISTEEIQPSLRQMVLARRVMPTMCGAALRGMGVEPVLDCVAEYRECGHFLSRLIDVGSCNYISYQPKILQCRVLWIDLCCKPAKLLHHFQVNFIRQISFADKQYRAQAIPCTVSLMRSAFNVN